jgi:hypothetical protein
MGLPKRTPERPPGGLDLGSGHETTRPGEFAELPKGEAISVACRLLVLEGNPLCPCGEFTGWLTSIAITKTPPKRRAHSSHRHGGPPVRRRQDAVETWPN